MEGSQQECSHLSLSPVATRAALLDLLGRAREATNTAGKHVCCDCDTEVNDDRLMVCLQCAPEIQLRCSRYSDNQHAYHHYQKTQHAICADLHTTSVWCYICNQEAYLPDDDAGEVEVGDAPNREVSPEISNPPQLSESYPNPIAKFREVAGYFGDQSWKLSRNKSGGKSGLFNISNTCFLNSLLQALLHIPEVIDVFTQRRFLQDDFKFGSNHERVLSSFTELLVKIWSGEYSACSPRELLRHIWVLNPIFRGYDQQDTQELVRCLVDYLHDAMKHRVPIQFNNGNSMRIAERSLVQDLFQGLLLSQVTCERCQNVSDVYEPFMDLSLGIPSKQQLKKAGDHSESSRFGLGSTGILSNFLSALSWSSTPILTLDMCLQSFCSQEDLIKPDQYDCEKCKQKVNASKVLSIGRCPEILTLHIKRFAHNHYFGSKLTTPIDFPLEDLDLQPYIRKPPPSETTKLGDKLVASNDTCQYNLISIVKHLGSLNGGHYVSYAKHHLTGAWYEFDDQCCTEVSEDTVRSQEAYMLFYRKVRSNTLSRPFDNFLEASLSLKDVFPKVYLSLYWLKRAELFSNPGPIDNWSLCCGHGVPLPGDHSNTRALQISKSAWEKLHKEFGGGPMIYVDHPEEITQCKECLDNRRQSENRRITYLIEDYPSNREVYLISESWFSEWRRFIAGGSIPGPINNSILFEGDDTVTPRPGLQCNKDYKCFNAQTWKELHRIYGGGPIVVRSSEDLYEEQEMTSTASPQSSAI